MDHSINFKETVFILAGSGFCLWLAVREAKKAWGMGAAEYGKYLQQGRPKSWQKWPVYGALWRSIDKSPKVNLWQSKIITIVAIIMGLGGVIFGALNLYWISR